MSNFIVPISSLPTISSLSSTQGKAAAGQASDGITGTFSDMLSDAVQQLETTRDTASASTYDLAVGGSDDLHTGAINSVKYSTAVSYVSGITSAAISAYNELMRMSI